MSARLASTPTAHPSRRTPKRRWGSAPRRGGRRLAGRRGSAARWRGDDGSVLPLILFYCALSLLVVLLAVAATSLYLERKRLFTLADGAALVGAESFELDDVVLTADGARPELHPAAVAAAVSDYLDEAPDDFDGLELERATTLDGRSATVTLSARWRPPILVSFVPEGMRIEVTAVARSVFG